MTNETQVPRIDEVAKRSDSLKAAVENRVRAITLATSIAQNRAWTPADFKTCYTDIYTFLMEGQN